MCRWSIDEVLASRPAIRVNQVGYLPGRPMRATLVSRALNPLAFVVRDSPAACVVTGGGNRGRSRPEPTSGLTVHLLDFNRPRGSVLRLEAGGPSATRSASADCYRRLDRTPCGCSGSCARAWPSRRGAGRLRAAGRSRRPPPNRGDTDGAGLDRAGRGAAVPGLALRGHVRRLGRLVRRRRLRQVRDQRQHRRLAAAEHARRCSPTTARHWAHSSRPRCATSAGGSWTGCCGCRCRPVTRWPAWPSIGSTAPSGHRCPGWPTRTRQRGCCTDPRRPRRCSWPRSPPRARGYSPRRTGYARRLLAAARTAYAAAQRHPRSCAPDDQARFGGGPYGDDDSTDDVYWAAAELWLATGERVSTATPCCGRRCTPRRVRPGRVRLRPGGRTGPARPGPARHGLPDHDRVRASVVGPRTGWCGCRTASRGASRTRRPTAGTGGPTAESSTTSSCWPSPT